MLLNLWKNNKAWLFAGVICLVVLISLVFHLIDQHRYVRSNDAVVQGHFTALAAQVSGIIEEVYTDENLPVVKNQVLAKIESKDFSDRVRAAEAERESDRVLLEEAHQDAIRAQTLYHLHDISREDYEHAQTRYLQKQKEWEASVASQRRASIHQAYTLVRAPANGVIALRAANPGMEVSEGTPLFGIVYPDEKWIEAKIKETDLNALHIGESVQVKIDAIPGRTYQGTLQSISPSSEGLEAAIVPDNSAGNFTKYVQRVAVRIALPHTDEIREKFRVGISADVRFTRNDE